MSGEPPASMLLDTMQWILSMGGSNDLQAFLDRLPTQQIEALLVASEMNDSAFNASGVAVIPPRLQEIVGQTDLSVAVARDDHPNPRPRTSSSLSFMPIMNDVNLQAPPPPHHGMIAARTARQLPERPVARRAAADFAPEASATARQEQEQPDRPNINNGSDHQHHAHATSLSIESDQTFLDPLHNFLRSSCIEVFEATKNDMTAPGRGARPTEIGQVGLRCIHCKDVPRHGLARQAVCFPSKRDTIFDSVRNYQRTHLDACSHIPSETKALYKNLLKEQDSHPQKKPQKVLKAYYAQAASELGLVDTPNGLMFGTSPNRSGSPSERLQEIIRAAESPDKFASIWKARSLSSNNDDAMQIMKKFEHVASDATRTVLINARKEPTPFVHPQDFPATSDVDFLLFHQVQPIRPTPERLELRGLNPNRFQSLCGLCCKHCAARDAEKKTSSHSSGGVYFPVDLASLADSAFRQSLLNHVTRCSNVPSEVKDALEELKSLTVDFGITNKRGSKKRFIKKIWGRMENYYE